MKVNDALRQGMEVLTTISDSSRLDAELLLAAAMQRPRSYLYAHPDEVLSEPALKIWEHFLQGRQAHYPLAYLLGEKEFWSLSFKLSPHTLIPRPATEALVDYILTFYRRHSELRICDLGTGSGAIAIALAKARPQWQLTAVDLSSSALAMAAWNASRHQCQNIQFICSSWFKRLPYQRFDLIVANPPYIDAADPHIERLQHEPRQALVAKDQGMSDLRLIMQQSLDHLHPHGQLVLEHGYKQQSLVLQALNQLGYQDIGGGQDEDKLPRFCYGFCPNLTQEPALATDV